MPPDLACFGSLLRLFGVRAAFGTSDWVSVLRILASETGVPGVAPPLPAAALVTAAPKGSAKAGTAAPAAKTEAALGSPLSTTQLELALALVQAISDDTMRAGDLEVSLLLLYFFEVFNVKSCSFEYV